MRVARPGCGHGGKEGRPERVNPSETTVGARGRAGTAAALVAVLLAAVVVRLAGWSEVFAPDGVRLATDGDTYYHALRAERVARDWPHVPWRDGGMNYPYGAEIPWPPLLDQVTAGIARAGGASPDGERVAAVAAILPLVLSAGLALAAALLAGVLLGGGPWVEGALLVALLPAAVRHGVVGRSDHHVLEALLFTAACATFGAALRPGRAGWGRPAALGAILALAFWNWPGSALDLLVLAAFVGIAHLATRGPGGVAERAAVLLARGAGIAAVLLAALVAFAGPPGALTRGNLMPISGLAVALCGATAASAGLVVLLRRVDEAAGWPRRAAHLVAAAALPVAAAALVFPPLREGLAHGLTAAGASNTWWASIGEMGPPLLGGTLPWTTEVRLFLGLFGLSALLLPVAAWRLRRDAAAAPDARAALGFFAVVAGTVVTLGFARRRFDIYLVVVLAITTAYAIRWIARAARSRLGLGAGAEVALRAAALAAVLAPGLPLLVDGSLGGPPQLPEKIPLLRWLRAMPPPAPGREAVLSEWSFGHEIQWFARKPVIATPFGTEIDPRSIEDAAAFFLEADPRAAEALLRRRGVGFLFLASPAEEVALLHGFVPDRPVAVGVTRSLSRGLQYDVREPFGGLVASRLFYFDGSWPVPGGASLDGYRLIAESPQTTSVLSVTTQLLKVFQVVDGATVRVEGAEPGALVAAIVPVDSPVGRSFVWTTAAAADPGGRATLRVPYATGPNGTVRAGACAVTDGRREQSVEIAEAAVLGGGTIDVALPR
jgi:dolichyl-diphosphooligosaccharide--protein glycosyltransferase